jgi:hypothetical protein
MRTLKGMKVKITLNKNNQAIYPDFNNLQVIKDENVSFEIYIERNSQGGWIQDQTSDIKTDSGSESPHGVHYAMLLMPAAFIDQACAVFKDTCTALDEAAIEEFFNNKVQINAPVETIDNGILQGIKDKVALGGTKETYDDDALDKHSDTPGVRINKYKTWALYKVLKNITIET